MIVWLERIHFKYETRVTHLHLNMGDGFFSKMVTNSNCHFIKQAFGFLTKYILIFSIYTIYILYIYIYTIYTLYTLC